MFSKAVLTLLAIAALSVNVSATPIPIVPHYLPLKTEIVEKRGMFGSGMDKSTKLALGAGIPLTLLAIGGGVGAGLTQDHHEAQNTRREPELESEDHSDYVAAFKREPASDEALYYLPSLSEREPEPVLTS